jgi:N-acetylmuramoyl-L-alanine amidase
MKAEENQRLPAAPDPPEPEEALAAASSGAVPPPEAVSLESDVPATPAPHQTRRFERRTPAPGNRGGWGRWLLAWVGLLLFTGCLFELLRSGPLPSWSWSWLRGRSSGTSSAGLVVIDPGHGGWDTGAVAQGVVEKDLNLDVGLRVSQALRARGVIVKLTRADDHFIPLEGRVRMANGWPGAIFVSIHFNDAPNTSRAPSKASGIETFYSDTREPAPVADWIWTSAFGGQRESPAAVAAQQNEAVRRSQALADSIQGTLIASTAAADRGIKERALYVTRRVQGPAVLVEGGFVSHPSEARRLGDRAYRQQLADSIAGGIIKYLEAERRRPASAPLTLTALQG